MRLHSGQSRASIMFAGLRCVLRATWCQPPITVVRISRFSLIQSTSSLLSSWSWSCSFRRHRAAVPRAVAETPDKARDGDHLRGALPPCSAALPLVVALSAARSGLAFDI